MMKLYDTPEARLQARAAAARARRLERSKIVVPSSKPIVDLARFDPILKATFIQQTTEASPAEAVLVRRAFKALRKAVTTTTTSQMKG